MISRDVATTERLLSQAGRGNSLATVELFDNELKAMYETACLLLGGADDALEIVRQAVGAAVDNLGALKDASRFSSWARTFVVSGTLQYILERRPPVLNSDPTDYEPLTVERWGDCESGEILELFLSAVRPSESVSHDPAPDSFRLILHRQLKSLPDSLRIAFVLHDILGFRIDETCSFLAVSPEVVKCLLATARHELVVTILGALRKMAVAMHGSDDALTNLGGSACQVQLEHANQIELYGSLGTTG